MKTYYFIFLLFVTFVSKAQVEQKVNQKKYWAQAGAVTDKKSAQWFSVWP